MLENCTKCGLCEFAIKKCGPKGTEDNVSIYFVGEAPGPEENQNGEVFVGSAGKYLHSLLNEFGLNTNNSRFWNVVCCYPQISETNHSFRAPSDEEIDICKENVFEDIRKYKPKVIVTLGYTALKTFCPDIKGGITANRGIQKSWEDYIIIPTLHPSYLMRQRNNQKIHDDFRNDIKSAIAVCTGKPISSEVRENNSTTKLCLSYREFNEFCKDYIDNYPIVGYDVETNSEEVHSISHEVIGFSLAPSSKIGCYITLKSLDFEIDANDRRLIEKRLRSILLNKKVYVYNCQHELPVTLNWLGIEIKDIEDIFVKVKLMTGSASGSFLGKRGLKFQSVKNLGYPDWSKDIDTYFDLFNSFEKNRDEIRKLIEKYYDNQEVEGVMKLVEDRYFENGPSYSFLNIPYKMVGRYGSIDSSVLFELNNYYDEKMDEQGKELGIDMQKGYKYWMWHHYAGYTLEKNGAYWNEDKARAVKKWCIDGEKDSIKFLVKSELSEPYIKSKVYNRFLEYLKDNYISEILEDNYTPRKLYKTSVDVICNNEESRDRLKRMSIIPKVLKSGLRIYKLQLANIETLSKKFLYNNSEIYDNWYRDFINNYVNEDHDLSEYKPIINPNATGGDFKKFISDMLITPDIRYARAYSNLCKLIESPDFYIEYYMDFRDKNSKRIDNSYKYSRDFDFESFKNSNSNIEYIDNESSKLMKLIVKLDSYEEASKSRKVDMFKKYILNKGDTKYLGRITNQIKESLTYELKSLDSDSMNEIYELYLMCHIDVEDRSTWTDKFEWLFNYKIYKKFSKILSTYIDGKVGHDNVYLVDKKSFSSGDYFTKRESIYDGGEIPEDKQTMIQLDFKVNMAATGRWQAGVHNLPASDTIKGIYTSRFYGGCIAMPDGSQMEVRTLAAESQDENLIKAFNDGLDIHRFFASRIYQVPYDEVQSWQRGLAKNAVFGMLYGESEKTFAISYLHGDESRAREIYDGMFSGFPKIKDYIDRAHEQFKKYTKVSTLTQRFINVEDPRSDFNRLLRQSQNFPIQASAEDIAGIILYQLCKWLKDNNMKSKPFCFIHDSIEIDIYPYELFQIIDKINYLFNIYPMEEFSVPIACDVPIGPSMGQEITTEDYDFSDDYNDNWITLSGFEDDIEELVNNWKLVYKLVERDESFDEGESKKVYIPVGEMFLPKKARISSHSGKYRNKIKRRYHVIMK